MITIINNDIDVDAQLEVWGWKRDLYEEIKNLDKYDRFEYIINKAKITKEKLIKRQEKAKLNK
jgi:hypothetical protein